LFIIIGEPDAVRLTCTVNKDLIATCGYFIVVQEWENGIL
jgi:hypothetical protein